MKSKIILTLFLILGFYVYSQDISTEKALKAASELKEDGWKKGGIFNVNFSQVSLTNWAGGGVNSISLNGLLNAFANYRKGKTTWENNISLGYGLTKQGKADFFKNDDRIDLTSKFGKNAFDKWYYAALVNFRSQMVVGFSNPGDTIPISNFLAPGYLLGAIGMDYKPSKDFTLFIAPLTSKTTFVMDQDLADAGAFGVEAAQKDVLGNTLPGTGQNIRNEFGGYVRMAYTKTEILKNVNFTTKLDLFSNYLNNPGNIDINWETAIGMKVNKYIMVSLSALVIYDDDIKINTGNDVEGNPIIGPRTQYKQVFGAGFSYNF